MQIYLPSASLSNVAYAAVQTQVTDLPPGGRKIETNVEVEHVSGVGNRPFTILTATINREFKRFGADSFQLLLDGFAGGDSPYFQFRIEGCRTKSREGLTARVCAGLGMYHDISAGSVSPVAGVSGTVDFWHGRVSNYFLVERAFTAPTFTYYHGETALVLVNAKRSQVSAGVLSRTIQPVGAKVMFRIKQFQIYGSAGKNAHSFGMCDQEVRRMHNRQNLIRVAE